VSGNVFLIALSPVLNGSFLCPFPLLGSAKFYSHSRPSPIGYSHFLPLSFPYYLSSHLLLFSMKQITRKLTCNKWKSFGIKKQLKINLKMQMSKLGHIRVFLPIIYVIRSRINLMWVGNGKCSVFIPFHSRHSHALSYSHEQE